MMKKYKKLNVTETLDDDIAPYEFERNLGDLVEFVKKLAKTHGNDAYLDWNPDYWVSRYDSSPSPRFLIKKVRPENDQEYKLRVDKEIEAHKQIAERELAELERLKKKYGESIS